MCNLLCSYRSLRNLGCDNGCIRYLRRFYCTIRNSIFIYCSIVNVVPTYCTLRYIGNCTIAILKGCYMVYYIGDGATNTCRSILACLCGVGNALALRS